MQGSSVRRPRDNSEKKQRDSKENRPNVSAHKKSMNVNKPS